MMCSYYDERELEKAKTVSDKELNELLQEVRNRDDRYYLQEEKHTIKKWFKDPVEIVRYTLLLNLGGSECQIINFCQDHEWSINGSVSKSYIHTLFCGYLNGYKCAEEKQKHLNQLTDNSEIN